MRAAACHSRRGAKVRRLSALDGSPSWYWVECSRGLDQRLLVSGGETNVEPGSRGRGCDWRLGRGLGAAERKRLGGDLPGVKEGRRPAQQPRRRLVGRRRGIHKAGAIQEAENLTRAGPE
jgi:hypothetical protein